VEALGDRVSLDNPRGAGTGVYVEFPVTKPTASAPACHRPAAPDPAVDSGAAMSGGLPKTRTSRAIGAGVAGGPLAYSPGGAVRRRGRVGASGA